MSDADQSKLPWGKLIGAYTLLFCEAINTTSFFTYVGFMVVHFGISNEENVGFYSGFVASSFSIAQFLSSFLWGKLSDKYGRKPILLLGSIGSIISGMGIGFSNNLTLLIITRSINGILNGNIGVVKTYIGEVTNKHNQVQAFGWIGMTWGSGSIIGPLVGGILIYPDRNLSFLFKNSKLFDTYPFLLPNLVISLLTLGGLVFTYFYMNETLKLRSNNIQMTTEINSEFTTTINNNKPSNTQEEENLINDTSSNISSPTTISLESPELGSINYDKKSKDDEFQNIDLNDSGSKINPLKKSFQKLYKKIFTKKSNYSQLNDDEIEITSSKKEAKKSKSINENVFKNKLILATATLYMVVGFVYTMLDESFPIWALAPINKGGLGFSPTKVGACGAIGGVVVIFIQLFVIKKVCSKYGIINIFMVGNLLSVLVFLLLPSMNLIAVEPNSKDYTKKEAFFWIIMTLVMILRQFSGQFVFSPIMILINNSAPNILKGQANGLGQSLVAFSRSIAPSFASITLAWSLTNGLSFPLNWFLVFIVMSAMSIIPATATRYLPLSLNAPIPEETDDFSLEAEENDQTSISDIVEIQDYDEDVVVLFEKTTPDYKKNIDDNGDSGNILTETQDYTSSPTIISSPIHSLYNINQDSNQLLNNELKEIQEIHPI